MQWVGKAIGGVLGFAVVGPVGSVVGVLVGHLLDKELESRRQATDARDATADTPEEVSRLFFAVTFETMGHIAKVDGRVSEQEIRVARRVMHELKLSPEQVRSAIEHFTAGKSPTYPLAARLAALGSHLDSRRELARAFVEIQMQAAVGVGQVGTEKRQLLWRVSSALGVGRVELAQIEALVRIRQYGARPSGHAAGGLDAAYRALGVEQDASDAQVKKAYRRLMSQHHPDKLVARGLPESMMGHAQQKTHEIRAAYERIKQQRGFK